MAKKEKKRPQGRPMTVDGVAVLTVRLDRKTRDRIDLLSKSGGVSRGKIVRDAVEDLYSKTTADVDLSDCKATKKMDRETKPK